MLTQFLPTLHGDYKPPWETIFLAGGGEALPTKQLAPALVAATSRHVSSSKLRKLRNVIRGYR